MSRPTERATYKTLVIRWQDIRACPKMALGAQHYSLTPDGQIVCECRKKEEKNV